MVVEDVDHEITLPYKLDQCSNIPEGEMSGPQYKKT